MTQMRYNYDYGTTYRQALRINWQIEDIIGGEKILDFQQPFLPETWVSATALDFLSATEQLTVNHIRSHSYLYLFGLVEEYILPFLVDYTRTRIHKAEHEEIRALLHFAEEESKHIELFQRFGDEFRAGFGHACEVIGPPDAIAKAVLSQSPLGVALSILQIEWMTLLHYVASARDNGSIDPQFASLLRHHWMEESQHAKLDTLLVTSLAQDLSEQDISQGIDDYLTIGGMFDEAFGQQVELDLATLSRATGRQLAASAVERYRSVQRQAYRHTFLTSGMRHSAFVDVLTALSPEGARKVAEVASILVPEDSK